MLFLYHPRNTFANFLSNVLNSSAPSWRAQRKRLFQKLAFGQAHKSHFQNSRERPRRLGTAFTEKLESTQYTSNITTSEVHNWRTPHAPSSKSCHADAC